jgi:aminomethyltransferase
MLVVNASNIDKDWEWISSHNDLGAEMKNLSDEYSLLAIQGPKAASSMQLISSVNLDEIPYYHFEIATFAGIVVTAVNFMINT